METGLAGELDGQVQANVFAGLDGCGGRCNAFLRDKVDCTKLVASAPDIPRARKSMLD